MVLAAGTRLGPYEVVSPIGKGGMGEVYRARDTKLDRDVAIKVLPEEFANDEERLARFEREAKLLASLNHLNIASIYGFESGAIVLELVVGPTLAERIEQGSIPVDEAIAIAKQIADALEAGHEAGIIHRDLKPANIKLKEDGTVKVLDYGLAKALVDDASSSSDSELSQSPTLTRQGTQIGVILGTAAYMSPEQAKGKRVDKRTDIWAFGAVLYEMLTGKRAFGGEDISETLAAVIRAEPDFESIPGGAPEAIYRVLRRCLTKDVRARLADIADARLDFMDASTSGVDVSPAAEPLAFWQRTTWLLAMGAVLVILIALAVRNTPRPTSSGGELARYTVSLPENDLLNMTTGGLAVSRDGRRLAYVANHDLVKQLFVRERDRVDPVPLEGTEDAESPFFSPDGEWLGFFRGNALMKVALAGGSPQRVSDALNPRGATWGSDDIIVFATQAIGLLMVPASGGVPVPLEATEGAYSPSFLQDGASVMFAASAGGRARTVTVRELASGEERELVDGSDPRLVADHLVFVRESSLWAAPFDADRAVIAGEAVPILDAVNVVEESQIASYDVSTDGTLTYVPGATAGRLVRVDPAVGSTVLERLPAYHSIALSPDGGKVVGDGSGVWVLDLDKGTRLPVSMACCAIWSPDGARIAYGNKTKAADGTGDEQILFEDKTLEVDGFVFATSWSPDGNWVASVRGERLIDDNYDIWIYDASGVGRAYVTTPGRDMAAAFSPDGRWIAYQSDYSGRTEVYVEPFPGPGERVAVSAQGGTSPVWKPDGSELYYRHDTAVVAVSVRADPSFSVSAPRHVLDGPYWLDPTGHLAFGVFGDGGLLMIDTGQANEIHVVLNWTEELKRLVPMDN